MPSKGAAHTLRFLVARGEGGRPARGWVTNRSVDRRLALRPMVNRKFGPRQIYLDYIYFSETKFAVHHES